MTSFRPNHISSAAKALGVSPPPLEILQSSRQKAALDAMAYVCLPYSVIVWPELRKATLLGRNYKPLGTDQTGWYDYTEYAQHYPDLDWAKLADLIRVDSSPARDCFQGWLWQNTPRTRAQWLSMVRHLDQLSAALGRDWRGK